MHEVVGQEAAVGLLRSALASGHVHHAYLFTGPRQVGKTSLAAAFVRSLNCSGLDRPCLIDQPGSEPCRPCRLIARGIHPDVRFVELPEERSRISYREIELLQAEAALRPVEATHKAYVILGAERLSHTAANQLLKTLEEPPAGVVLALTALEAEALLPTIVSRCQEVRLARVPAATILAHLETRLGVDRQTAERLANLARGRIGWAIQAAADPELLQRREHALAQLRQALQGTRLDRLQIARALADQWSARSPLVLDTLQMWIDWLRDAVRVHLGMDNRVADHEQLGQLRVATAQLSLPRLRSAIAALQRALADLDANANPRLALDVAVLNVGAGRSGGRGVKAGL